MSKMRTQVVIIGAGPAGALLSLRLNQAKIDNVVLEQRSRAHVLSRIRAGVLEYGSAEALRHLGVGARMDHEGFIHTGVDLAYHGRKFRIDFANGAGVPVVIYGQTEVQKDLYAAMDERSCTPYFECEDVALHHVQSDLPQVTCIRDGASMHLECDYVVGCDGYHGVSRSTIPAHALQVYERVYPFGWLGILSETAPVSPELIYANHERGFALCSMRNHRLSRYYIQCPIGTEPEHWSDGRFWDELRRRLPADVSNRMEIGPSIEKSVTPLRSFVAEPLRFGQLFLAGDAAHIVPPTGAKGLNLAFSDVQYLADALVARYRDGAQQALERYSDVALSRVWRAVRFSWWMTTLLHRFADDNDFSQRIQEAELDLLAQSRPAQDLFALQYVGLA